MARGTPTYFSGTLSGTNQVEDLYTELETRIKAYQSNAQDAWEEWDVITATAGSRDIVFRSLGDRTLTGGGDAALFIRLTQTTASAMRLRCYQDWSNLSSSGSNEAGGTSGTNGSITGLSSTGDIEYFGLSNEYEFIFVFVQGGSYRYIAFGSPKRTHIPPAGSGVAYTSNAETAGASVVVEVDRDITSSITVGQKIWVYNVTPNATALRSDNVNVTTVEAKAAGSLTLASLANNIEAGAIIGLDPSPMYVNASTIGPVTIYFTVHANGVREGAATNNISNSSEVEPLVELMTEGVLDPANGTDLYHGSQAILDDNDVTDGGARGTPELMSFWPIGTQANQDRMIPNYDTSQAHKVFTSLVNGSFCLGIGPGATA